jgi:hypothetical protein
MEKCTSCQVDIPLAFIVENDNDNECHEIKKKRQPKTSLWNNPFVYIVLIIILWVIFAPPSSSKTTTK